MPLVRIQRLFEQTLKPRNPKMTTPIAFTQRLGIGTKAIAWFLLTVLFIIGLPVVLVWPKWVFGIVVALALVLAVPLFLIRRYWAHRREGYSAGRSYALISLGLLMLLVAVLAAPVYYLGYLVDTRPTVVPQVALTDGKKTVVFQGMVHVGSEDFYKGVVYDLEKALAEGYTLFYEGVQDSPDSKEATEWFKKSLAGGGDLNTNYQMLADLCGTRFQLDYFGALKADEKLHPERHVTADVSHLDMYNEYLRLAKADPAFASAWDKATQKGKNGGADDKVFEWAMRGMKDSTEGQKYVAGVLCRGFMSMTLSSLGPKGDAKEPVILDFRNRYLAKRITTSPADKIYITYGGAHLPGVMQELRKLNPAWKTVAMKWMRAIEAPEHLDGALSLVPAGKP
jgi:hypothetical protein